MCIQKNPQSNSASLIKTYNVGEAKTHLSSLLDEVQRGVEVIVARNGKPIARLTEQFEALATLMRNSWGQDSPLFRQIFTDAFFPTASASETAFFNELQRRTTTPENASRILDALGDVDVRAELSRVKVPTLVLHSRGDQIVPISDGMELAAGIEGARFVSIDSSNHMLLSHEPGWQRVCAEIDRFADSLTPS